MVDIENKLEYDMQGKGKRGRKNQTFEVYEQEVREKQRELRELLDGTTVKSLQKKYRNQISAYESRLRKRQETEAFKNKSSGIAAVMKSVLSIIETKGSASLQAKVCGAIAPDVQKISYDLQNLFSFDESCISSNEQADS